MQNKKPCGIIKLLKGEKYEKISITSPWRE